MRSRCLIDLSLIGRTAIHWIENQSDLITSCEVLEQVVIAAFLAEKLGARSEFFHKLIENLKPNYAYSAPMRAVLSHLGLSEPLEFPQPVPLPQSRSILTASPDSLDMLISQVEQATAFGVRPAAADPDLGLVLMGTALTYLNLYDLEFGARLLRAAAYTVEKKSDRGLTWGIEYICRQQRSDGAFGYIAVDLSDDIHTEDPLIDLAYYLPVTVACLWTLAELALDNFRLFSVSFEN